VGVGAFRPACGHRHKFPRSWPGDDSLAKQNGLAFPIFTLDTGLLFPETIELKEAARRFFRFRDSIARTGPHG
jgi:3'-phosphoadenosine 5'-phosphosulfate sulfotransferase (PAPS reductase)/FAD synthetase